MHLQRLLQHAFQRSAALQLSNRHGEGLLSAQLGPGLGEQAPLVALATSGTEKQKEKAAAVPVPAARSSSDGGIERSLILFDEVDVTCEEDA